MNVPLLISRAVVFLQAEDGIRDVAVTGVQTCALPILFADYYQCYGPGTGYDNSLTSTCFSPSATWRSLERNTHQQHELRLSTPDDWRWRAIGGAYWEDNKLFDQTGWGYKTGPSRNPNRPGGRPGNSGCLW